MFFDGLIIGFVVGVFVGFYISFRKNSKIEQILNEQIDYVLDACHFYWVRICCLIPVAIISFLVVYVYTVIIRLVFLSNDFSEVFEKNYWAIICMGGYVCVKIVPSLVRLFSPDSAAILFDKKSVEKEDK